MLENFVEPRVAPFELSLSRVGYLLNLSSGDKPLNSGHSVWLTTGDGRESQLI